MLPLYHTSGRTHTHINAHTNTQTKAISRNQAYISYKLACACFKICSNSKSHNMYLKQVLLVYRKFSNFFICIPYNGNHPRKKSFANCLLCRSSRENFRDSGNLIIYKNSGRDRKCKKTFANASRFAKFMKLFFRG